MKFSKIITFNRYKKFNTEDAKTKPKYDNRQGWKNTFVLMLIFFSWFWVLGAMSLVIGENSDGESVIFGQNYFGFKDTSEFTLFTSLFLILNIISLFLYTVLLDAISIKKLLNYGYLIALFSMLGLFFSYHNPKLAYLFAATYGLSGGLVVLPMLKLSFQWFEPKKVGFPISFAIGVALSGGVIIGFVGKPITQIPITHGIANIHYVQNDSSGTTGAGGLLLIFTLAMIFFIWLLSLTLKERKSLIGKHYLGLKKYSKYFGKALIKPRNIMVPLIISLINLPVSVLAWSVGTTFISSYYGINGNVINYILPVLLIFNVLGSFFWGKVTDIIGLRKPLLFIGSLIIAILAFITVIKLNLALIFVLYALIGFFCAAQNMGYPMLTEQNPPEYAGSANTINSVILLGLGAIIQHIYGIANISENGVPSWLPWILPIFMTIPIFLSIIIRETGPNAKNQKIIKKMQEL